jgi:hypothetical protein
MSSPSDDDADSELNKYAPKWHREQPATPDAERLRSVGPPPSIARWSTENHQNRQITPLSPRPVPEPPARGEDGLVSRTGQMVLVAGVAAVVALGVVFGKSLLEGGNPLNSDSQTKQVSKPSDSLTASDVPANRALVPAAGIAAAPGAATSATAQAQAPLSSGQGQQAALSPTSKPLGQDSSVSSTFRGVTDREIRFGISAPFTGTAKELGQNMKRGIETAFNVANANGGVYGRQLRLVAADDGYEPARAAVTMKQLYERDQVFGLIGNVGTPTAVVALPYALTACRGAWQERRWLRLSSGFCRLDPVTSAWSPPSGAKRTSRGTALERLARSNAPQWGTHIRHRNRKCSDAVAVVRSVAAIRALAT